jgi:hypothetical protein
MLARRHQALHWVADERAALIDAAALLSPVAATKRTLRCVQSTVFNMPRSVEEPYGRRARTERPFRP